MKKSQKKGFLKGILGRKNLSKSAKKADSRESGLHFE